MLLKSTTLPADEVILDLEDSVAPSAKAAARRAAMAALESHRWTGTVALRINARGTDWCDADVAALVRAPRPPATVVIPKVESAADVAYVEERLTEISRRKQAVGIQALIESAAGLVRLEEIAACSERLVALVLGYVDLAASLRRRPPEDADPALWDGIRDRIVVAARANGLQAIDGPDVRLSGGEALAGAATRARDLGFDGKWAIHPSQVETLNRVFTPGDEEVEQATQILKALCEAEERGGDGAVALGETMIDRASAARARMIEARGAPKTGEGSCTRRAAYLSAPARPELRRIPLRAMVVLDAFSRRVVGWSIGHNRRPDDQRAGDGGRATRSGPRRDRDPPGPRSAVHLLGVQGTRTPVQARPLDGLDRRLLRL